MSQQQVFDSISSKPPDINTPAITSTNDYQTTSFKDKLLASEHETIISINSMANLWYQMETIENDTKSSSENGTYNTTHHVQLSKEDMQRIYYP